MGRRAVTLLASGGVLLAGLVVDEVARTLAEDRVADELLARFPGARDVEVDVRGRPVLPDVVGGRLDEVRVAATVTPADLRGLPGTAGAAGADLEVSAVQRVEGGLRVEVVLRDVGA